MPIAIRSSSTRLTAQVTSEWYFASQNHSVFVLVKLKEMQDIQILHQNGAVAVAKETLTDNINRIGYHLLVQMFPHDSHVSVLRTFEMSLTMDAFYHCASTITTLLVLGQWKPLSLTFVHLNKIIKFFPQLRDFGWTAAHIAAILGFENVFKKLIQTNCFHPSVTIEKTLNEPSCVQKASQTPAKTLASSIVTKSGLNRNSANRLKNAKQLMTRTGRKLMQAGRKSANAVSPNSNAYLEGIQVDWLCRPSRNEKPESFEVSNCLPTLSETHLYVQKLQQQLTSQSRTSRLCPLVLSIIFNQTESFKMIFKLLFNSHISTNKDDKRSKDYSKNKSNWLFVRDANGNNLLHILAWSTEPGSVELLNFIQNQIQHSELLGLLGQRNRFGCWPLHVACFRHNLPFVYAILRFRLPVQLLQLSCPSVTGEGFYDQNENYTVDLENELIKLNEKTLATFINSEVVRGGGPLHWTCSSHEMSKLALMLTTKSRSSNLVGLSVNVLHEQPLHVAVRRRFWLNAVALFYSMHGGSGDQLTTNTIAGGGGDELGDYPLHVAVRLRLYPFVQLLLLLEDTHLSGSALNRINLNGHTCRHLAAQRLCLEDEQILQALHVAGAFRCKNNQTLNILENELDFTSKVNSPNSPNTSVSFTSLVTLTSTQPGSKFSSLSSSTLSSLSSGPHSPNLNTSFFALNKLKTNFYMSKTSLNQNKLECTSGCSVEGTYNGLESNMISSEVSDACSWLTELLSEETLDRLYTQLKNECKVLQCKSPPSSLHQSERWTSSNAFNGTFSNQSTRTINEKSALRLKGVQVPGPQLLRLLSVDGGGIRGLVAVQILLEIQRHLKYPFSEYFNWYGGTSTGSLVCALLALGYSLIDTRLAYLLLKNRIFSGTFVCDSVRFESYLKRLAGDRNLDQIKHCKMTTTATLFDRKPIKLHMFRNYKNAEQMLGLDSLHATFDTNKTNLLPNNTAQINEAPLLPNPSKIKLWQVCRASSAAPRFFSPFGSFCDGGILSNNPAIDLITELLMYNKIATHQRLAIENKSKVQFMLTIGTGQSASRLTNRYAYDFSVLTQSVRSMVNPIGWYNAVNASWKCVNLLGSACTLTDGHVASRLASSCFANEIPFVRINSLLTRDVRINERDDRILVQAMFDVCICLRSTKLQEILNKLTRVLECAHLLSRPNFAQIRCKQINLLPEDLSNNASMDVNLNVTNTNANVDSSPMMSNLTTTNLSSSVSFNNNNVKNNSIINQQKSAEDVLRLLFNSEF